MFFKWMFCKNKVVFNGNSYLITKLLLMGRKVGI